MNPKPLGFLSLIFQQPSIIMKQIAIVFFILFCSSILFSQNKIVTGIVTDTLGESLIGASVLLSAKKDSTMMGFSLTDIKGNFKIENIQEGEYFLQVTYMGYINHIEYAKIDSINGAVHDFKTIQLKEGNTLLEEIVIMEDRIPILIKKDTIEYHAGSFQVHENAVVEELLKEMPGIEIEEDGTIKANGKEVENVLVDGKEFFNNPEMATKNLPAKAIDKVQVYDKKSEEVQFAGLDFGNKQRTINLKLKEGYKKGYFGKTELGGGTEKTFKTNMNLNQFNKKNQLSFITKSNNVNKSEFSINEYIDFMGGMKNFMSNNGSGSLRLNIPMPLSENGNNNGINTSAIAGMNFNKTINNHLEWSSNYLFNLLNTDLTQESEQSNLLENLNYNTLISSQQKDKYHNHALNTKLKFHKDSLRRLTIKNNVQFSKGSNQANKNISNIQQNKINDIQDINNFSKSLTWKINSDLLFQQKLKKNRVLNLNSNLNYSNNAADSENSSQISYLDEGGNTINEYQQFRITEKNQPQIQFSQSGTYIHPIGKYIKWINQYKFSNHTYKENNDSVEEINSEWIENKDLSLDNQLKHVFHNTSSRMEYIRKNYSFGLGIDFQNSFIHFQNNNQLSQKNKYNYWLPSANIRWNINKANNIYFTYNTQLSIPNISQLNPIINNTNPTFIVRGNTDLQPQYEHNFNFNYFLFQQFSFNSFSLNANAKIINNTIIQQQNIDENFVQHLEKINSKKSVQYNFSASYGTPISFIHSRLNLKYTSLINYRPNLINDNYFTNRYSMQTLVASISNKRKKKIDISFKYQFDYNRNKNMETLVRTTPFLQHRTTLKTNYTFKKGFRLGNSLTYNLFTNQSETKNNTFLLWNIFIEKTIFKNKRGLIRLSVSDILNQNKGIFRESNNYYSIEQQSNTLRRYAMLSFSYNLAFFGK